MSGRAEKEKRRQQGIRIGHDRRQERRERAWDAKMAEKVKIGGATLGTLLTVFGIVSSTDIAVLLGTAMLFGTGFNVVWDKITNRQ